MDATQPASSPTLVSLQALRAIAALMVLAAHIRPDLLLFGAGVAFPDLTAGAAGVDLFSSFPASR
jgi:peptidoglycan/LPS O-acetylase OafA/YrhL